MTDTHLDEDNFEKVYDIHKQVIDLCLKEGIDKIFHLGDHFTSRASQKLRTLINFDKIIKLLEESGVKMYTIAGNHDKTDQSIDNSYIDLYKSDNFIVGKKDFKRLDISDEISAWFLPYYTDEVYLETLKAMKKSEDFCVLNRNILLTHFGLDGVLDNSGNEVKASVKQSDFQAYDKVFIGHYHNNTKVSEKINYIGSTDPRNFGEDSDKGVLLLREDLSTERVKLKFKEYKKIVIEDVSDLTLKPLLEKYKDRTDLEVRFEFKCEESDFVKIDKKVIESLGISVTHTQKNRIDPNKEIKEVDFSLVMDNGNKINLFKEYCSENEISEQKYSKILKMF